MDIKLNFVYIQGALYLPGQTLHALENNRLVE